ncbi:MAG: YjgP/YjgQ family permease [Bacteroidales bacterium]|nr:YjgP/YjgQ family permease [Bacteroidales bacterium]
MKKIHLMVLRAYIGPFVLTFFIALFVLLMQFVWKYVDDLVGKGLEWYHIARLLFYASSTFVPLALPLAILLSSIMTFGNLGENYELVAMKSAGISLGKAMLPLIILSVFISIGAFFFNNGVLPVANLKFKSLLYDIRKQKLAINIQPGIFYSGIDNYVIRVDNKNDETNTLYGVMVYDHSDQMGNMKLSTAGKGHMYLTPDEKYLIFTLYNGANYTEQFNERNYRNRRQLQIINYEENRRKFDLYGFGLQRTNEELFRSNYQMMNIHQLDYAIDSLGRDFKGRVNEFSHSVTGRFSFLQMVDSTHQIPDSIKPVGTFFEHFKPASRKRVIETALQNLRSNKEYVVNNANELKVRTTTLNRHKVVWHQKFTLSVACLLFFFIGAPLGAIVRKGGLGLPVVMSAFIFVIFHIISITGEKYAVSGAAEIIPAIWIAPAILLPAGLWLSWKAITDSPILDMETYTRFFNLFIPKKYRFKVAEDIHQQSTSK